MNITVEEALKVYPLSEGKIVAGIKGISRVISALNLMDAPDISNWIKEGELLLTTGYAIKDSPEDFVLLLQNINKRGSAGLGIKLGRYWKEIPEIVLEEANRLQIPLIELPFKFTFSEQITALFQSQFERNTKKLNDVLETQKKLVNFAMQADEYTNYFQKLADILKHPIAVVGTTGKLLYNVTRCSEAELLKSWPWNLDHKLSRVNHNFFYRIPLLKNGSCHGFLIIMPPGLPELHAEEGAFHQAAVILSYHMESIQNQEAAAASLRLGKAIERFLQGKTSVEVMLDQAKTIGTHIWNGSYIAIVSTAASTTYDSEWHKSVLRDIHLQIQEYPLLAPNESHHFFVFDKLFSLFSLIEKDAKDNGSIELIANSYVKLLHSLIAEPAKSYVSKIKRNAEEMLLGYEECMEAQRISEQLAFDAPLIFFQDLEFYYLFRYIPNEIMTNYCDYLLSPLLQKDEEYVSEMLRTLEAYFANNGQINEAAKELYIHRNTVLYRLEKIGQILSIDFKNTNHLMQMKLALMFTRLIRSSSK